MKTKLVCREAVLCQIDSCMNQVIHTAENSIHTVERVCAHTNYKVGTVGWLFKMECKTRNFFFFIDKDEIKSITNKKRPVVTQFSPK